MSKSDSSSFLYCIVRRDVESSSSHVTFESPWTFFYSRNDADRVSQGTSASSLTRLQDQYRSVRMGPGRVVVSINLLRLWRRVWKNMAILMGFVRMIRVLMTILGIVRRNCSIYNLICIYCT